MLEGTGEFWLILLILFGVSLICSSIGFKKFVYFLSVGYGLSVFGIGLAITIFAATAGLQNGFNIYTSYWPTYFLAAILMLYGLRLSGYLTFREIKSASYRKTLVEASGKDTEKKMPLFVKITIWISVAILYILQTYPVTFRMAEITGDNIATGFILPLIGGIIALIGLGTETLADIQKSMSKKKNPHSFVSTGLYRYVRCPNYLGEIIFWTGIFVSGCDLFASDWVAWVFSILGYLLIVYVMISGAKRLEGRQAKNYGNNPDYQAYTSKVPIISRLIPIKSFKNWNWVK